MTLFDCELQATSGHARALSYETAHGSFQTPMFMPVGTSASVKGVTVGQLNDLGSQVVLANTYHLSLRPGADVVAEAGGVHRFMNYDGPMLTDSGGFQVFSLADTLKLDDEGLTFRSIYDGTKVRWTPESNMEIQEQLGADIAMQLDQCTPYPAEKAFVAKAVDLSANWARRCLAAHQRPDQTLFGIVQGGMELDLRLESIRRLREIEDESLARGGRRFGGFGLGAALGCGGGAVEQHGFHAARIEARMLAHEIGVVVVGVHERPARALRQRAQKLGLGARDVLAAAQKLDMALAHVHHEAPIGAHVVA